MLDTLFTGLFDASTAADITPGAFVLCVAVSLGIGLLLCVLTLWNTPYSKSFAVSLAVLPAVVCVVILMVNGNVGTGVAVAGAFNLVRFRSAPGTAREISALFIAMGAGLIAGMGYLGYAVLFALLLGGAVLVYNTVRTGEAAAALRFRTLHITIPEDLDYVGVFDPVLQRHCRRYTLQSVRTTNMGSLFKLTYDVTLRDPGQEKALLDALRRRNGNLEISLNHRETAAAAL